MELIAKSVGFYKNARVRVGQKFDFTGDPDKLPKWAVLPEADTAAAPMPLNGDTKPVNAQKASRAKSSGLSGTVD